MFHYVASKILNVICGKVDDSFIASVHREADEHILACLMLIGTIICTIGWIS